MNKALNKYVNDIIAIAGANNKSWDVGSNMFITNAKNVGIEGAPYYPGADHLDWAAVAAALAPITPATEADMLNTFAKDYRAHMSEVIAARKVGDYVKAIEVMTHE